MAYRYGDRHQALMFPPTLEELIEPTDPVRAYDAFVDALDLEGLGMTVDACKPGCPEYFPRVMLKILVFGYAYGLRSSRKLERALYHNIAFLWPGALWAGASSRTIRQSRSFAGRTRQP